SSAESLGPCKISLDFFSNQATFRGLRTETRSDLVVRPASAHVSRGGKTFMISSSLFVVTLALAGSVNATSVGIAGGNGAIGDGSAVPATATGYGPNTGLDTVHRWNRIAVDASGIDHTPVAPGEDRVFGEQLGPGRSSRAMAIVHIAIFDSVNAIVGGYQSYTQFQSPRGRASIDAAVGQ